MADIFTKVEIQIVQISPLVWHFNPLLKNNTAVLFYTILRRMMALILHHQ
jgi:hypothetical protein